MLFADPTLTEFYRDLHIDREWSVCAPTHFTWWADQQAQHITVRTADAALDDEDPGVLIAVRTELLRGVTLDATAASALNSRLMAFASLAGPIYDPATGSVALHSLLRVHDDTRPWLTRLLSLAAVLQISEARRLAPELARLLGAEVAVSGPPERGIRPVADEMTGVVPQLIAPQGCAPSRWLAAEFLDIRDQYLQQPPALLATGDGAGLTVEFPWDDTHTALLQIMGDQPHPEYGNGLFVLQSFPVGEIDEAAGQRLALRLNAVELAEEPAGYGLGSYCYQRNLLHFVSFFPNFAYRPGLLPNLYYAAAQRAQALADRRYPALTADDGHE
ncbi:MAG: hypothetical protein QG599_459 [Pseudomonadota bacterium]|nr:hypothetical protein [Pseudomonadota bacterium]